MVPSSVATAPAEKPKFYSSSNTHTLLSNEVLPFLLDYSNIKDEKQFLFEYQTR